MTDFSPTDEPHSSDKGLQYIAHPYFEPTGQRNVVEDHAAVTTEDGGHALEMIEMTRDRCTNEHRAAS